jgi:lipopolysaccharide/colanic/teichoic acid biosynthesis glycosyltransferase
VESIKLESEKADASRARFAAIDVPRRPPTVKHALDRVAAVVTLTVLLPVLIATSVLISLSLGRPIVFRQTRVGRDGNTFEMLKFRTMPASAAEEDGEDIALVRDGRAPGGIDERRLSRVGGFLRRTSLDELPQLINVIRGEMSLIGPRPERPTYASFFERTVPHYRDRHRVKPGITGWAQVHGLSGRTSIARRAHYDSFYVKNCSLRLDLKIALLTFGALFRKWRAGE